MASRETYLGDVQDVNGTTVSVSLSSQSLNGFVYIEGQGYRVNQLGSFVRIPIGFCDLFGIVSQVGASAAPSNLDVSGGGTRWMKVQLIGESTRNGSFQRGLAQYPTIGDEVHLVSERELKRIYGEHEKPHFVRVGHIANAQSIPALVDVNKLITRHSAVVGTTGAGKSTTVASIVNALSDSARYPSARIVMLDLHGEYGHALRDRAQIFKIGADKGSRKGEKELFVPFWALNFDELCELSFGAFSNEKDRNLVLERVQKAKSDSLKRTPRMGATQDNVSVDSPVPFSIHELWYQLYVETFATYYKGRDGKPTDNLAFELQADGSEMRGDAANGIVPIFRNVVTDAGAEKIHYLPNALQIGKQVTLLGTKLRIPRYDFIFKPGAWLPDENGSVKADLDSLLKDWIGTEKPVTVLDLSGVPTDILQTTIGAVLRILYEALFWSRDLSQGGRHRPLLVVMEEAHSYLNDRTDGMAARIVQRIVKEGRKYGISSMIVSQRPSEIHPTILSQCGTFFALRLANSVDRNHIASAMPDNLEGLTSTLPILRTGEALVLGEAVKLPMRTIIEPPPKSSRPDSQDPVVFDEISAEESQQPGGWGIRSESNPNFAEVVETWRAQNPRISKVKP